jgi:hypothetical protein
MALNSYDTEYKQICRLVYNGYKLVFENNKISISKNGLLINVILISELNKFYSLVEGLLK